MAGHFEIVARSDGRFMFHLKAGNEVVLVSEAYTTKSACASGIESVKANAAEDDRYRRTTTPEGRFRFALEAANNQTVGSSEYYDTAAERDEAIAKVKENAPDAEVTDLT